MSMSRSSAIAGTAHVDGHAVEIQDHRHRRPRRPTRHSARPQGGPLRRRRRVRPSPMRRDRTRHFGKRHGGCSWRFAGARSVTASMTRVKPSRQVSGRQSATPPTKSPRHVDLRRASRSEHERPGMESRPDARHRGDSPARERARPTSPTAGKGTVSLGEMRKGGVGLCVATLIARYVKPGNRCPAFTAPRSPGPRRRASSPGIGRWKKPAR